MQVGRCKLAGGSNRYGFVKWIALQAPRTDCQVVSACGLLGKLDGRFVRSTQQMNRLGELAGRIARTSYWRRYCSFVGLVWQKTPRKGYECGGRKTFWQDMPRKGRCAGPLWGFGAFGNLFSPGGLGLLVLFAFVTCGFPIDVSTIPRFALSAARLACRFVWESDPCAAYPARKTGFV